MDTPEYITIKNLKKDIESLNTSLKEKQNQLKTAIKDLQSVCEHDFFAEHNGDYHKPGWYYTCSICNYWTNCRPNKVHKTI
jgi:hypothetical protein